MTNEVINKGTVMKNNNKYYIYMVKRPLFWDKDKNANATFFLRWNEYIFEMYTNTLNLGWKSFLFSHKNYITQINPWEKTLFNLLQNLIGPY